MAGRKAPRPAHERLAERVPELKVAVEKYGLSMPWTDIVDYKLAYTENHKYCAMLFKTGEYEYDIVDFACGVDWECQNDSFGGVTLQAFKKAYIVAECDWLGGLPEEE